MSLTLPEISERLRTQNNRMTSNPMFQLRIKVRDVGYDPDYGDKECWHDSANGITIYDDDPDFKEPEGEDWERFGYKDRWEIVMVAFTKKGLEEYMELDGHNVKRRAFRGQWEIYVNTFSRCPEMIAIREELLKLGKEQEPILTGAMVEKFQADMKAMMEPASPGAATQQCGGEIQKDRLAVLDTEICQSCAERTPGNIIHDSSKPPVQEPVSSRYAWLKINLQNMGMFKTWEEEIAYMKSLGYELVPPDYPIPSWHEALKLGDKFKKLYIPRKDGPGEARTHYDCPACELGYPVYFKVSS